MNVHICVFWELIETAIALIIALSIVPGTFWGLGSLGVWAGFDVFWYLIYFAYFIGIFLVFVPYMGFIVVPILLHIIASIPVAIRMFLVILPVQFISDKMGLNGSDDAIAVAFVLVFVLDLFLLRRYTTFYFVELPSERPPRLVKVCFNEVTLYFKSIFK